MTHENTPPAQATQRRKPDPAYPAIGIDIDGCVDEFPRFFSVLASHWPGKVYVISFRDNRQKAEEYLARFGVVYCELILVNSFQEKAAVIAREGIAAFFDDQPEVLKPIAPECNVMLVRNGGNLDFDDGKWMFSRQTGKLV